MSEVLPAGTLVAGYRVERELGRGNMAIVYLALQLNLERLVALKVLTRELAGDEEYVKRFFNEAKAAAQLAHPNIVQAYDAGVAAAGIHYFAMEYVEGENLDRWLAREGLLEPKIALPIAVDIAGALDYGWRKQRLTHGDIKPENTMISNEGVTKLADFGLAKVEGHDFAGEGLMLTPLYAAPEVVQAKHEPGDCRADIYSLGATLYHLLCGSPPFQGDAETVMAKQVSEIPVAAAERNPRIPRDVSDYVTSLLAKSPDQRPSTWEKVGKDLKKLERAVRTGQQVRRTFKVKRLPEVSVAPASGTPKRLVVVPKRRSRAGIVISSLVVVAVTVAGLLTWHFGRGQTAARPAPSSVIAPPVPPQEDRLKAQDAAARDWQRLKARMPGAGSPEQRLTLLETFQEQHGPNTPLEVFAALREARELVKLSAEPGTGPPTGAMVDGGLRPSDEVAAGHFADRVLEDAEDGRVDRWEVYDPVPPGEVRNVLDLDNPGNRVIQLIGGGTGTGYRLLFGEPERDRRRVCWRMKFDEPYLVFFSCRTNFGPRYLGYGPTKMDRPGGDVYVHVVLGADSYNGQWWIIERDLQNDLEQAQPGCKIAAVDAMLVRGSGFIDDVVFVGGPAIPATASRDVASPPLGPTPRAEPPSFRSRFEVDVDLMSLCLYDPVVHEDAEHGNTVRWDVYDERSEIAGRITNVVDPDTPSNRIIKLAGDGSKTGYRFSFDPPESERPLLQWRMRYDHYVVYVFGQSSEGRRYVQYTARPRDMPSQDGYVYQALGEDTGRGEWVTIRRDLRQDMAAGVPDFELFTVESLMFRGDGYVDDIISFRVPPDPKRDFRAAVVIEDAEGGDVKAWRVHGEPGPDGGVTNVPDPVRPGNRVIGLRQTGGMKGFSLPLERPDTQRRHVSWCMMFEGDCSVYVVCTTNAGVRHLRYTPADRDVPGDGREVRFGLGPCAGKGLWLFVHRDLQEDLERAQPGCRITSVDGFLVQGTGFLDDIILFGGFRDGQP